MTFGSKAVNPKSNPGEVERNEYLERGGVSKPFFFSLSENSASSAMLPRNPARFIPPSVKGNWSGKANFVAESKKASRRSAYSRRLRRTCLKNAPLSMNSASVA